MLQPSQGFVLPAEDRLRLRHDMRVLEVAPDLALQIGGCQGFHGRSVASQRVLEDMRERIERMSPRRRSLLVDVTSGMLNGSAGRKNLRHHHGDPWMVGRKLPAALAKVLR